MLDKNHNKIGHNSLSNNNSNNKNLKTTKKGFFVSYDTAGFRIDYYNTRPLRRFLRKGLIKLRVFEYIKNLKKRLQPKSWVIERMMKSYILETNK